MIRPGRDGRGSRWRLRASPPLAVAVALAACGSINVRPHLTPLPDAFVDTLAADPAAVIVTASRVVARANLRVAALSAAEGYLETHWFDVARGRTAGAGRIDVRRLVRVRFFADSVGLGRTRLVSEAVVRRTADPSIPPREGEMMAPRDHAGRELLRALRDSLRGRIDG